MSTAQKVILTLVLVAVYWEAIDALQCYSCTFCNNPNSTKTCSATDQSCYTDNTVILGRNITWRGCSDKPANSTCETKLEKWGYKGITTCRCSTDLCNSFVYGGAPVPVALSVSSLLMILLAGNWFLY